jgi:catalase
MSDNAVLEVIPPSEEEAVAKLLPFLENMIRQGFTQSPPARRDAHPKAHGCVMATFEVLDTIPVALKVGLFAEPRTYNAWIRFSNSNPKLQEDSKRDARGMAIKVMNVAGSESTTQDFLLVNFPVFLAKDAASYAVLEMSGPREFILPGWNPFQFRAREFWNIFRAMMQNTTNPLLIRYWSMSPFLFGDRACKFSARPRQTTSRFTGTDGPNFLRNNMAGQLAESSVTFDFMVQLRTDPDSMPIEDPTIEWSEDKSPFIPVATITIMQQTFDTAEQNRVGENLSFVPWHCLPEHRPLGGINRLRRRVYDAISALRHNLNGAVRTEPTDFTL